VLSTDSVKQPVLSLVVRLKISMIVVCVGGCPWKRLVNHQKKLQRRHDRHRG
jgi:hypothetical protein